jgi:hypothetical protein
MKVNGYGVPRRIDPRDGLIEEYWRTAGAVAYCERRVQELGPDELTWGTAEDVEQTGVVGGDDGGGGGIIGNRRKSKAAPNVWVTLYQQERKRFAELGVEIVRLGLEARRDQAAERYAAQLAGVVRLFVAELGLTAAQQERVPAALASAMAALRGQTADQGPGALPTVADPG